MRLIKAFLASIGTMIAVTLAWVFIEYLVGEFGMRILGVIFFILPTLMMTLMYYEKFKEKK